MANPFLQNEWQTTRINLVEAANQRFSDYYVLTTDSGIVGTGLVGAMIVGITTVVVKDIRLINCFPTRIKNNFSNDYKTYISKRPGFVSNTTPAAVAGNALRIWLGQGSGNKVVSAFGTVNSTIYDGVTSLGAITGLARDITETFIGTTATLVIPSSDSTAWYYPDGGALTKIADVDFPGNAGLTTTGTFVHLDGYAFIMTTDGRIWNSDLASITSWNSQGFISSQLSPDRGVGLARYKNKIVAFGKESIEFFEDVGNATGSPLQRNPEHFIKLGSPSQNVICSIEDTLVFVASSSTGSYGVYTLDNYNPRKISYPEIDSVLSTIGINNFTASAIRLWGKPLFILHSSNKTFVYSLEDDIWMEWTSTNPLWYRVAGDTAENIYSISNSTSASVVGKVFTVNQQTISYMDNGSDFTMTINTSKFDAGTTKRKRLSRLKVIGDISENYNPLTIVYSDDDYLNYSNIKTIDLSNPYQYLNNLGMFRRRSFSLNSSSGYACRLEALELDWIMGGN